MSMQISVDPAALSQEQREAVAGFILAYPSSAGTCGHAVAEIPAFIHKDTADAGLVEVGREVLNHSMSAKGAAEFELATLQHDHESTLPVTAFGQPVVDEAAAAFGVPVAPLALSTPPAATGSIVAPPPPANTAPITTTSGVASSPTATLTPGVDLDAKGFPWDNRIHAGTKRKNADGSWTAKRGVDPALVATVEAELRQVMGAAPAAPLAPAVPAPPPTAPIAPVVVSAPQVTAPPAPAVAPAAPAGEVPADARAQFVALVGRASAAIQGQKVTQAEVNQCCADAGVPALPLLANRLDLVAQVAAHIDALIAARQ